MSTLPDYPIKVGQRYSLGGGKTAVITAVARRDTEHGPRSSVQYDLFGAAPHVASRGVGVWADEFWGMGGILVYDPPANTGAANG